MKTPDARLRAILRILAAPSEDVYRRSHRLTQQGDPERDPLQFMDACIVQQRFQQDDIPKQEW